MIVTVECAHCGAETQMDICGAVKAIIEAAEHRSIFGGFLCTQCGETDEDAED